MQYALWNVNNVYSTVNSVYAMFAASRHKNLTF